MNTTPDGPPPPRARARALGIEIGTMAPGPTNSIVDVANVSVGHATVWFDEPAPPAGRGVARTGVTAIVPFSPQEVFRAPVPVGAAVLNGAGELTGFLQAEEWGSLETPVFLTRTMGVGRVYDGAVDVMLAADPEVGDPDVVIPMVGECDDSWLSDGRSVQVEAADVGRAVAGARGADGGPVVEGAVGAGTGMCCLGFKGGIGSSSRQVDVRRTRSARSSCRTSDHGEDLIVDGVPVGRDFAASGWQFARDEPAGQLHRRAGDGRADDVASAVDASLVGPGSAWPAPVRSATTAAARSSSRSAPAPACPRAGGSAVVHAAQLADEALNPFFAAAVEATEEAVINSLVAADTVVGHAGHEARAIPLDRLTEILRAAGRLPPT